MEVAHSPSQSREARIAAYTGKVNVTAMNYVNERVIERLMFKEGLSRQDAEVLFRDMLQFLCLSGARAGAQLTPPRRVDEAWHHFILFTRDYAEFCNKYFGRFIHHQPFEPGQGCGDSGQCSSSYHGPGEESDEFTHHRPTSIQITAGLAHENFAPLSTNWHYPEMETLQ